jgi:hypothetical protein
MIPSSSAHLILTLDISMGKDPKIKNATIHSEPSKSLEKLSSGRECFFDGPKATGIDYEDARKKLIKYLHDEPSWKWVFSYVK